VVAAGLDAENSALAWLIAQPLVTAPIVSATNLTQLQDVLRAPTLALTPEDLATLDTGDS